MAVDEGLLGFRSRGISAGVFAAVFSTRRGSGVCAVDDALGGKRSVCVAESEEFASGGDETEGDRVAQASTRSSGATMTR